MAQIHGSIKYRRAIVLFFITGISALLFFFYREITLCRNYTCIDLPLLANAKETEVYEQTKTSYRALLSASDGQIRFSRHSGLTKTDAATLTQVTIMKIQGLFDNALSPYPGPLSSVVRCDDKYKPTPKIEKNGLTEITMFTGFLNNRLQYGSCIDSQLTHKGYSAIMYCEKEQAWYHVELIVPLDGKPDDTRIFNQLQEASCK